MVNGDSKVMELINAGYTPTGTIQVYRCGCSKQVHNKVITWKRCSIHAKKPLVHKVVVTVNDRDSAWKVKEIIEEKTCFMAHIEVSST